MFEMVIFDWDETLAHTKNTAVKSFKKTLEEINLNVSNEYIKKQMGKSAKEILLETLKKFNKQYNEDKIEQLLQKRIQTEIKLSQKIKLHDGAIELLDKIKGKTKLALATMNDKPVITHLLKQHKLTEYFDIVLSANDVKKSKPNPEIFLEAANKFTIQPNNCVVIEDSIFGIQAAKKAKMSCIAVSLGAYSKKELEKEKPDLVVTSLKQIKPILNFILQ
ncbi:MAG: HAD family phosphatase [Candidatus Bathyarchaeota archaeon]